MSRTFFLVENPDDPTEFMLLGMHLVGGPLAHLHVWSRPGLPRTQLRLTGWTGRDATAVLPWVVGLADLLKRIEAGQLARAQLELLCGGRIERPAGWWARQAERLRAEVDGGLDEALDAGIGWPPSPPPPLPRWRVLAGRVRDAWMRLP